MRMEMDIRKLGDYLLEVTREGLAHERVVLEWQRQKQEETAPQQLLKKAS